MKISCSSQKNIELVFQTDNNMGYDTYFEGMFKLNKPLDKSTKKLIKGLSETRRVARDLTKLDMTKKQAGVYGIEGEFYIKGKGFMGQDADASVLDENKPPSTQPNLWCQWVYNKELCSIEWDDGEKFYNYVEWILYLVDSVLEPKGYVLNGKVTWQGEDKDDKGTIIMENNTLIIEY